MNGHNDLLSPNKEKYPNCYKGHKYALDVVSGEIDVCKYVRGSCERYLRDLKISQENEFPTYYIDLHEAERYMRLTQKFEHVIGEWETATMKYEPWQCFQWLNIMGWQNSLTGNRRFRIAHLEEPRGNGKSAKASLAALYFGFLTEGEGNIVSCVATKKEQARIVLDSARAMALKNKSFLRKKRVDVRAHDIVQKDSLAKVRALSNDKNGLDGLQDVLAICDELHAMSKEVFELITSGMSKRRDSLVLCITTAGFNVESVGHSQSAYAKKVALGEVEDDTFFSMVYTIDEKDDPLTVESLKKANPNWGISVDPVTIEAKLQKAKEVPSDIPNIKVKHLNVWLSEANAFFTQSKWDKCEDKSLDLEDFKNKKCFVGLDLASKIDLTCFFFVFKEDDIYYLFDKTYIPEERLKDSVNKTLYQNAAGQGHLITTPGEAIHYPKIQEDFIALSRKYQFKEVHFDPWNATEFAQRMEAQRISMTEFRMNTANLSEPTKRLDALIREGKVRHNGSPLLRWCLGNVVAKEDNAGNVFPKKSNEKLKIDPIIAAIMAMAGWVQEEENSSVYESRPIRFI